MSYWYSGYVLKSDRDVSDHRNSITTAYANNVANEYTTIEDVPGGGGAVSVYSDAAGNISLNEDEYEYGYDHDNRLTKVTYEGGFGSIQAAHYEYDALGRMISSQMRFDSDVNFDNETLKYYYDGQNAIAEYDPSDNLSSWIDTPTTWTESSGISART